MLTPHLNFKAPLDKGVWQLRKNQWKELQRIVGPQNLLLDEQERALYSGDASPVMPVSPAGVVLPATSQEISDIMRFAHGESLPVTVRGGGSGKVGGAIPIFGGLVLSTERLRGVSEVDRASRTLMASAGMLLKDVKDHAKALNLHYAPDPGSVDLASLGGSIATNAGGMSSMKYGVTGDHVLALRVILADGRSLLVGHKSPKGVVGYDLTRLMVGSEGTLGIISEALLKLVPVVAHQETGLFVFETVPECTAFLAQALGRDFEPRAAEFFDGWAYRSIQRLARAQHMELPQGGAALLLEVEGSEEGAARLFEQIRSVAEGCGVLGLWQAQDDDERNVLWTLRSQLSKAVKEGFEYYVSEDVGLPLSQLANFVHFVETRCQHEHISTLVYGHAGDGNLHVNFLFQDVAFYDQVHELLKQLFLQVVSLGGTISGEHGVGLTKRDFISLEQGTELLSLQRSLKAHFDPRGILNPGKVFPQG